MWKYSSLFLWPLWFTCQVCRTSKGFVAINHGPLGHCLMIEVIKSILVREGKHWLVRHAQICWLLVGGCEPVETVDRFGEECVSPGNLKEIIKKFFKSCTFIEKPKVLKVEIAQVCNYHSTCTSQEVLKDRCVLNCKSELLAILKLSFAGFPLALIHTKLSVKSVCSPVGCLI